MSSTFDVIVLGLGAAGSSAIYHLSKSGKRICGIDQYSPPHNFGSSHGQSRIIRQAYHENPLYVPLIMKAYDLWEEIEKNSGQELFLRTGGLMLGSADSGVITGAEISARTHSIPYEYLERKEVNKRFPAFISQTDTVGILEKNAGILFPEKCITANIELAGRNGVQLHLGEKVISIKHHIDSVEIKTSKGTYTAEKIIISAGAWTTELLPELGLPLTVERQILFWFRDASSEQKSLGPGSLPIYIWEHAPGEIFYGFPDLGDGIKVARHHAGLLTNPHILTKYVEQHEIMDMESLVKEHFNIDPAFNYATTCMYTNTPDEDFIIDHHPHNDNIIIASPCSGHGFKFASVTGKILSDMAQDKSTGFDLSMFSLSRFQH
jgi:sarcosine oxidase